jgi:2,3-bisphosphoglycerate-independent phosphoglycerate mutase
MNAVWVFVDGLGIGESDPGRNPCLDGRMRILSACRTGKEPGRLPFDGIMIPADAVFGVEGLPQSATGQTALFAGVDAPRLAGRHVPGFPNDPLRAILRERSFLKRAVECGLRPAFANAYRPLFFDLKEETRWRLSATTVSMLAAGLPFFRIEQIRDGECLYHDFTNAFLIRRGFDVPPFTPERAGAILAGIAQRHDLVLYEYFLTDRAGHRANRATSLEVLDLLDRFLHSLLDAVDRAETLVLVASDHGNIEDLSSDRHTRNPVPVFAWGPGRDRIADRVRSIADVAPVLLDLLGAGRGDSP